MRGRCTREIDEIAGHGHARVGCLAFVERDEAERLPELAHRLEIAAGHAVLGEVTAQRSVARFAVAGEMRRRFLHAHRLAGRIEKSEFVERVVADALPGQLDAVLLDDMRVRGDVRDARR